MNRKSKRPLTTYDLEVKELRRRFMRLLDIIRPPMAMLPLSKEMGVHLETLSGFMRERKRTTPRIYLILKKWISEREQKEGVRNEDELK